MPDHQFERDVIESLAELKTKMNILVGEDGTGGWKRDVEGRVRRVEGHRWKLAGFSTAAGGIGGSIFGFILDWWRHAR